jgi:hypothetical protein
VDGLPPQPHSIAFLCFANRLQRPLLLEPIERLIHGGCGCVRLTASSAVREPSGQIKLCEDAVRISHDVGQGHPELIIRRLAGQLSSVIARRVTYRRRAQGGGHIIRLSLVQFQYLCYGAARMGAGYVIALNLTSLASHN